jgi:hypothetical protein
MRSQVRRVAYADPLFSASLKAEMANYPELSALAPRDGEADPPEKLFGNRRKGYFKCKSLCRVWTLITFRWLRKRGEFFVVWTDPSSGTSFDGRFVLAHAFTIKYISLHQPGLSVVFKPDGALKSTSVHFQKIRRYVCSYMCVHICVVIGICVRVRCRYVWANRNNLARSVHDMSQQMYANKKYATEAWSPLLTWLFECKMNEQQARRATLTAFNKSDTLFHDVVARCMWRLANGANMPWGRGAVKPRFYSAIAIHEKVPKCGIKSTFLFFFFSMYNLTTHI